MSNHAASAEIVEATGWQTQTVRSFVSILGSKGGEKVESSKNAAGEWTYRIAKIANIGPFPRKPVLVPAGAPLARAAAAKNPNCYLPFATFAANAVYQARGGTRVPLKRIGRAIDLGNRKH